MEGDGSLLLKFESFSVKKREFRRMHDIPTPRRTARRNMVERRVLWSSWITPLNSFRFFLASWWSWRSRGGCFKLIVDLRPFRCPKRKIGSWLRTPTNNQKKRPEIENSDPSEKNGRISVENFIFFMPYGAIKSDRRSTIWIVDLRPFQTKH